MVATCPYYRFVRFPSCGIFKPTRTIPVAVKDFNLFYVNMLTTFNTVFRRFFKVFFGGFVVVF